MSVAKRWQVWLLAVLTVGAGLVPALASAAEQKRTGAGDAVRNSIYIVRMVESPMLAYRGGVAGIAATKPAGRKMNRFDSNVLQYSAHLEARQDAVLAKVGARRIYSYKYAFNGFAAEMTEAQANALKSDPGVVTVEKDKKLYLDTRTTTEFLGLEASNGLWNRLGGAGKAGEDVVIGVIDGGIWPEHPSVSDRVNFQPSGALAYQPLSGWTGACQAGDQFTTANCNNKLIGARYYNAAWGGNAGINATFPWEFNSPRDHNGHGTHTASTAGGNRSVPATGAAAIFKKISGMAPRARISVYKSCWDDLVSGSCFSSDSVAAIDQAVADGVDVINYSISGSTTNFLDSVEVAFLNAADAGIFVAASAGNAGPTTATVAHPGPWLTTVAASTHSRNGVGSVTLSNDVTYTGASVAFPTKLVPLIDSTAAGLPGANPVAVALCFSTDENGGVPALDPAKVANKIVVCDRGVNARTDKSFAVKEANGVGMILVNTSPNTINPDLHYVPTVHLQSTDRAAIKAFAATGEPGARIRLATVIHNLAAPFTAGFSSRGPLRAGNGDLLKPDLIAPGQDIVAGVAPPGNDGRLFDVYSGTSMSSPHVAGIAALLKDLHPTWSPMMIKSALMSSAGDVLDGPNTDPAIIFRQGAGQIRPNNAADPGLVFDSNVFDWFGFLCGTQLSPSFCTGFGIPILDPSNLNLASIAVGDLAGSQVVRRTVTNVSDRTATYTASVTGMTGITVNVAPSSLTLTAGQSAAFDTTLTTTTAPLNTYAGGQLTWSDGAHNVRVPMVARPTALAAPAQVSGSYSVKFGYTGPFTATPRGLIPAATTSGTIADDPTDGPCSLTTPNAVLVPVTLPAGLTYARFSLFDTDVTPGTDLDLCVFQGAALVGLSGTGNSDEEINFVNPPATNLTVVIQGFGVAGTSPFKLHTWLLGTTAAGNMTVTAPATATLGATGAIGLAFSGLVSGTKYLGSVAYGGVAGLPNPTIVRVDP